MRAGSHLDADGVRRWTHLALRRLAAARAEIDALNVYPVPDGDTGTNLYLTVEAAVRALDDLPEGCGLPETTRALAHGALLGARGNSGIILSQLVRGIATAVAERGAGEPEGDARTSMGPSGLAAALARAADMAYEAVAKPVEGTMLTVARAAADAASGAVGAGPIGHVATTAASAAREALRRTPEQLDVLRRAGVVDAGGRGLTVLLDALAETVTGGGGAEPDDAQPEDPAVTVRADDHHGEAGPAYEVMYLLDAPAERLPLLRERLAGLGDSLVVVGGDGLWNVHVHVCDVGAAIEAGMDAGRPHGIRVTDLSAPPPASRSGRSVVTVVAGDGLAALSDAAGATVVRGGPGRRASLGELLEGIERAGTGEVVVLPNDPDSLAVAEAAAEQARAQGLRVAVIPTSATVQALAALAVHDPARRFDDDVVHMASAASHARHGAVTVATREAVTLAGPCRRGDVLGVVDGEFSLIGHDLVTVACGVVDRMLGDGSELVTLVTGEEAPAGLADAVVAHVERHRPDVGTLVYDGGQPRYPLLLGVE